MATAIDGDALKDWLEDELDHQQAIRANASGSYQASTTNLVDWGFKVVEEVKKRCKEAMRIDKPSSAS